MYPNGYAGPEEVPRARPPRQSSRAGAGSARQRESSYGTRMFVATGNGSVSLLYSIKSLLLLLIRYEDSYSCNLNRITLILLFGQILPTSLYLQLDQPRQHQLISALCLSLIMLVLPPTLYFGDGLDSYPPLLLLPLWWDNRRDI